MASKYTPEQKQKWTEQREAEMTDILKKLEDGVKEVFSSEKYKAFLTTMSKFTNYSYNNCLLISLQAPNATLCAGFNTWKSVGRYVNKGEKGIKILAPLIRKDENEEDRLFGFRTVATFDISQTNGKELPSLIEPLEGDIRLKEDILKALSEIADVPIEIEDMGENVYGYYHQKEKRIAIQSGLSDKHTVKTAIHEVAHALLHDKDRGQEKGIHKDVMELQAESIAFVVLSHYGYDTSNYSFGYLASWSEGKEIKQLKESLNTVQKTSSKIIQGLNEKLGLERNLETYIKNRKTKANTTQRSL